MAQDLAESWPSSSLRSDEGGLVVGSHGMNEERAMGFLAFLNRLWDGNAFDQRRIGRGHVRVEGRRFAVSLMMQEVALQRLIGTDAGVARGTGALARFLISAPDSTAGSRMYRPGDMSAPAFVEFDRRITELLELPLPVSDEQTMKLAPSVIYLNGAAFGLWREFHDHVEATLRPCGEFSEMKDFASKTAEQAARLACLFHLFEHGPQGNIALDAMKAATHIAWWHLNEARRVLGLVGKNEALLDAKALLEWLAAQPGGETASRILQYGPARVRTKARRDRALDRLYEHGLTRLEANQAGPVIAIHPACRRHPPAANAA